MGGFKLSPAAISDIAAIWDYTAERWSADQADRYTDDIKDACEALCSGRKVGRPVDVRPGYMKYAVGSHMLYFRQMDDWIVIVRILHQRMDVGTRL